MTTVDLNNLLDSFDSKWNKHLCKYFTVPENPFKIPVLWEKIVLKQGKTQGQCTADMNCISW